MSKLCMMDNNQAFTRRMPTGIQDFDELRKKNYLYADKTDMVWKIANGDKSNFLSRPRRFGKSLLVSTLQCYFEGRKELFDGLKIMQMETEWKKHQVFRFDFSNAGNTKVEIEQYLDFILSEYEKIYGRDEHAQSYNNRFYSLIQKAYEQTGEQVAVLIDEYDSPLQHTLFHEQEHLAIRDVYRSFFPVLKTASQFIQCLFITGITKFTQLSLFSVLNNLTNISFINEYSAVCGLTEDEIRTVFKPEVISTGQQMGLPFDDTISELKKMYDGYHFSEKSADIYNPYSVINALARGKIISYWMSSGGSSLLSEMLSHSSIDDASLDCIRISQDMLETSDVNTENVPLFLFQTGYLTIKDFHDGIYTLGFPNREVRTALYGITGYQIS